MPTTSDDEGRALVLGFRSILLALDDVVRVGGRKEGV